jgi:hypothetical protein
MILKKIDCYCIWENKDLFLFHTQNYKVIKKLWANCGHIKTKKPYR